MGCCRRGDRCKFEHADLDSSHREESLSRNVNNDQINRISNNTLNRRRYNTYENRASYNERNEYTQLEDRYQSNYNLYSKRYSFKGRYATGLVNRFSQKKCEWVSEDYRRQRDKRQNAEEYNTYNTSTLNNRVNFSIRDPKVPRTDYHVDLHMNEGKFVYVKLIKEDIKEWELGSQWPFTCYSPILRYNFPEFFDVSPEELRYEAYKASENNSADSYLKSVENALQNLDGLRNQLKNPSVELMSFIEDFCTRQDAIIGNDVVDVFKIKPISQ